MTKDEKELLGRKVTVIVDRPLGSRHPEYGFNYPINYGYVKEITAGDGDYMDAYILGVDAPLSSFSGICIAIIHRTNDNEDKLVIAPKGKKFSKEEIEKEVEFQEKWFKHELLS
jgi:inorganic pyrophosphatase